MTETRSLTPTTVAHRRAAMRRHSDDLKQIRGIGSVTEQHLHKAGIRSFAQLAAMTPNRLATSTGLPVRRIIKGNWVGQARKLERQKAKSHRVKSASVARERQHYATFTIELLLNEDNSVRRTRIVHIQSLVDEVWPDWDGTRLVNFLVTQAGLHVGSPELATPSTVVVPPEQPFKADSGSSGNELASSTESVLSPSPGATVSIEEGLLHLADKTSLDSVPQVNALVTVPCELVIPQDMICAGQMFSVRFSLELNELQRSAHTSLIYTVEVWAKKLGERLRQLAGEKKGTLIPGDEFLCIVETVIASQGTYRLEAIATLGQQNEESLPRYRFAAAQRSRLLQVYQLSGHHLLVSSLSNHDFQ
jgi:Helix-hairpin-helix domain